MKQIVCGTQYNGTGNISREIGDIIISITGQETSLIIIKETRDGYNSGGVLQNKDNSIRIMTPHDINEI